MKKTKIGLFLFVIVIVVIIFFQNQVYFMSEQSLGINIYFVSYNTPPIANIVMFIFCFIVGILITFIPFFSQKIKSDKIIKLLASRENSLKNIVHSLEKEIETIKNGTKDFHENK